MNPDVTPLSEMNDLENILKEIEIIRARTPGQSFHVPMNPPATIDQIEQRLTRVLGFKIPEDLKRFLLIHNGLRKGTWFDRYRPLSLEEIIAQWRDDRQREQEARGERDEVVKLPNHIPIMGDPTLHHKIYMDANDGSIMNYVVDGIYFEKFRYDTYLEFLIVAKDYLVRNAYFEWPNMD